MSDMKHTPGPWQTVPGHSIVQIKSPTQIICAVGSVACYENFTESDDANARLIAAAPELLEALEDAQAAFDAAIALTPTGPARNRLCNKNIQRITAIANARGQS